MDMLRTDRTYKTRENAFRALEKVCDKADATFVDYPAGTFSPDRIRYVIASAPGDRFAPVVMADSLPDHGSSWYAQNGVTVV